MSLCCGSRRKSTESTEEIPAKRKKLEISPPPNPALKMSTNPNTPPVPPSAAPGKKVAKKSKAKAAKKKPKTIPKPTFPVQEIHSMLLKGRAKNTVPAEVPLYLAAAEEYIATELIETAGNHAVSRGVTTIDIEDIVEVIMSDEELKKVLGDYLKKYVKMD